jgi:hypothetical protein
MSEQTPFRYRHDGWTPDRQATFLQVLGDTGCVTDACRAIGLTTTSAYRVRRRIPEFAEQWALALRRASVSLEAVAWKRAVDGVRETEYHQGKPVGVRIRYSDSLLRLLIQRCDMQANSPEQKARDRQAEMEDAASARARLIERLDALREGWNDDGMGGRDDG